METITQSKMQLTLSKHYAEIRKRLGDTRTPSRPIVRLDKITTRAADKSIGTTGSIEPDQPKKEIELPRFKEGLEVIKIQPRQSKLILEDVASRHGITVEELKSRSRKRNLTEARHEAYHLLRQAGYSWPQCAKFCGATDHTTAIHGATRYEARLKKRATL